MTDKWRRPTYTKNMNYKSILDFKYCSHCGDDSPNNLYFIDGNIKNILTSNIEKLCDICYTRSNDYPYITISKTMSFAACHRLPYYDGACSNWHGHEWIIEVSIRNRVNPNTNMVMDFKDLKTAMKKYIIDILDHGSVNDIIVNPTAENILIWSWEQLMFKGNLKGIQPFN